MARPTSGNNRPARHELFQPLRALVEDAPESALQALIRVFVESANEHYHTAQTALAQGDADALCRAAHTLRSMSAAAGAWTLARTAEELEDLLRGPVRHGHAREQTPLEHERARIDSLMQRMAEELAWVSSQADSQ